ncbi:MAG: SoxR reducing system RseC family protein [Clostridia bacterium]|nr:SoxR reducing system RseC family protein [Clostridia bacterium]
MIRTGRVVRADGNLLSVCFERPEMCQHCGACDHKKESFVKLTGNAKPGDRVDVDMPEGQLLRTSLVTYLVPIAALLLGMFLGNRFIGTEKGVALYGFLFLLVSLILVMLYDRYLRRSGNKTPKIIAVHPFEEENIHE